MSGGFQISDGVCNGTSYGVSGSTVGTQVAAGATANTKGAWVQLTASSSVDACFIDVEISADNVVDVNINNIAIDIGVGSAGNEVVIISNLHCYTFFGHCNIRYTFPVAIQAGVRIAARAQADSGTAPNSAFVSIRLFDGDFALQEASSGAEPIGGFNSANTTGTAITPGASGVKGSYIQITASAARDYVGLGFNMFFNSGSGHGYLIDLAIGGAGSEQIIVPDYAYYSMGIILQGPTFFPIQIPQGTRVAMRVSDSNASAQNFNTILYGLYK